LLLLNVVGLVIVVALSGWPRSFAAELPWLVPDWLQNHVGEGEDQISPVVLQRARALYLNKVSEGAVNNQPSRIQSISAPEHASIVF
jgi:hypothetical protein